MRRAAAMCMAAMAAALGAVALAAQDPQPPPQQQQPVIRSGINFVRVDVLVTDRKTGKPVTDLTLEDFEVVEDGKPQTVETFRLIDMDVPVVGEMADAAPIRSLDQQEREMARDDVRVIAILLDDYHVARGNDMAIREKLAAFVMQLNSRDLVAVLYPLTPVTDLVFTRNHEAVANQLMKFQGRKWDYTPRNRYEDRYASYPAATVERIRAQVSLSALRALSIHLGTLREGRKAILFVSEGLTYNIPPTITNPNDPNAPIFRPGDPTAGGGYTQSSAEFFSETEMNNDLRYVFNAANRANTSIYSLDPRGLAPFAYDINQGVSLERDRSHLRQTMDSLIILAQETGGRGIVGRNDFLTGLRQMLQDSSSYYLLGYNSTLARTDGKFHEIRVRVKRPGVDVQARKGYWALSVEDAKRAEASPETIRSGPPPEINEALAALAAPARGRPALTWIGTSRADHGRTQVSLVWEASAQGAQSRIGEAARVNVTASNAGGDLFFRGKGEPDADAAGRPRGGTVTFTAPPGALDLRIVIEGAGGEVLDTEVKSVTVPDYSAAGVTIGTPRLFRARTARDVAALRADASARPVAAREFSRSERLLVRFAAWGPGGAAPLVTARLLNMRGEPVADLPAPAPGPEGTFELDVPLSPYAPNDYLIELRSGDEADAARVLTALRIS
ncbi:MAG TPA: VWA domain-containing protein [Vicinamibacterales bacterium]|nr:VWA domain-containing protein [Vicinamibacterales bacterium]